MTSERSKCRDFLAFFILLKLSNVAITQKSTFTANFRPSPSIEVIFLLLFVAGAELQPLVLVHTDLASIFNIMTALHAGK